MATKVPRLSVTLSPEAALLIDEIAALTATTKSSVVSGLVDAGLPAMQTMLHALRIVKQQPQEAERLLARMAATAVADLGQAQLDLAAHMDARTMQGKRGRAANREKT